LIKGKIEKHEIEQELELYDILNNAERIPGIYTPSRGILGCTMSHLNAIKLAKEIIKMFSFSEDDYQFLVSKEEFENQI
jgi:hypothetical protein